MTQRDRKALFMCVGNEKFERILLQKMQQYFPARNITYLLMNDAFQGDDKVALGVPPSGRLRRLTWLLKHCFSNHIIILNSLFFGRSMLWFFYGLSFFKDLTWIVWGGDLYHDYDAKTESIRKRLICRLDRIAITIPDDERYFREKYPASLAVVTSFFFPLPVELPELQALQTIERKAGPLKILLGNSATLSNNHHEAIDLLKGLSVDCRLYLPLGYGDAKYADEVERYAKDKLGVDKVVALREFMEFKDYLQFLAEIDVAIFNQTRQQGGHNIFISLALGKHVFINPQNCIYDFVRELGVEVNTTDGLKQLSILQPGNNNLENLKKLRTLFDDTFLKRNLDVFFRDMKI